MGQFTIDFEINVTDAKQGHGDHMKTLGKNTLKCYAYIVEQAEVSYTKGYEGWDRCMYRFLPKELKGAIDTEALWRKALKILEYVGLIMSRDHNGRTEYRPRTQDELERIGYEVGLSDYLQKNAAALEQMRRDMGDEMFEKLSKAADQIDDDWFYGELSKMLNLK